MKAWGESPAGTQGCLRNPLPAQPSMGSQATVALELSAPWGHQGPAPPEGDGAGAGARAEPLLLALAHSSLLPGAAWAGAEGIPAFSDIALRHMV